jgi:hypothetical protein
MSTLPQTVGGLSRDTFVPIAAGKCKSILSMVAQRTLTVFSITHFTIPHWEEGCSVPLGIFPKIPQPEYEFFAARKMEWLPKLEGVQSFDLQPTVSLAGRDDK